MLTKPFKIIMLILWCTDIFILKIVFIMPLVMSQIHFYYSSTFTLCCLFSSPSTSDVSLIPASVHPSTFSGTPQPLQPPANSKRVSSRDDIDDVFLREVQILEER